MTPTAMVKAPSGDRTVMERVEREKKGWETDQIEELLLRTRWAAPTDNEEPEKARERLVRT